MRRLPDFALLVERPPQPQQLCPRGSGRGPHYHDQDEQFFDMDGEIIYLANGEELKAGAESFVLIPRVTFCRPEVASFGLTEEQAREEGYEVKVGRFPFLALAKALVEGGEGRFVKVVVDVETDLILGMHTVGPRVTDLITEGVFVKLVEGTPEELEMAVHGHPTLSVRRRWGWKDAPSTSKPPRSP